MRCLVISLDQIISVQVFLVDPIGIMKAWINACEDMESGQVGRGIIDGKNDGEIV